MSKLLRHCHSMVGIPGFDSYQVVPRIYLILIYWCMIYRCCCLQNHWILCLYFPMLIVQSWVGHIRWSCRDLNPSCPQLLLKSVPPSSQLHHFNCFHQVEPMNNIPGLLNLGSCPSSRPCFMWIVDFFDWHNSLWIAARTRDFVVGSKLIVLMIPCWIKEACRHRHFHLMARLEPMRLHVHR